MAYAISLGLEGIVTSLLSISAGAISSGVRGKTRNRKVSTGLGLYQYEQGFA